MYFDQLQLKLYNSQYFTVLVAHLLFYSVLLKQLVGRLEEHPPCKKCALKQLLPCPSVPGKLPLNWLCVYVVNLATR